MKFEDVSKVSTQQVAKERIKMTEDYRKEFLINVYNQMFNNINRHIMVVWQCVGTVVGAFALLSLAEKKLIPIDVAVSLIVLICGWLIAHLFDAAYWYNRNLVIISNIERELLQNEDLHNIHYYFGKHRPDKMITHLRIQCAFGWGMIIVVILFHVITRVIPNFQLTLTPKHIDVLKYLPYIVLVGDMLYLFILREQTKKKYAELIKNSPGITIETNDIEYGPGHGFSFEEESN